MQQNERINEGFIFLIEATILYIINSKGDICLINGEEEKIREYKTEEYYSFNNLIFIKDDNNTNYKIYDIAYNTTYIKLNIKPFFKEFAIIKLIALDPIMRDRDVTIKLINDSKIFNIKNNIQYISVVKKDDSTYFRQKVQLTINGNQNIFSLFIYKGQINSINCCYNDENVNNNKYYEILFLSKEINYLPSDINVSRFRIDNFDKFKCTNRIRFNVMNIQQDKNIYNYNSNISSLEIIYLINEKNQKIKYGVFDIDSFKENILINYQIDSEMKKFVDDFWDGYQLILRTSKNTKKYYNSKTNKMDKDLYNKLKIKTNLSIYKYTKSSLDNEETFLFFRNHIFFLFLDYLKYEPIWEQYSVYFDLVATIQDKRYENYDKIRILTEFILKTKDYNEIPTFVDIRDLDSNDAYSLAIHLQREIISNITEKSYIYYPVLQFNSKILKILPDGLWDSVNTKLRSIFNETLRDEYAYTISLEDLEDTKSHLLQIQEDFFFTFPKNNFLKIFGLYSHWTKITLINQNKLCKNLYDFKDESNEDYAFSINMVFGHERMGHAKEAIVNPLIESPYIYFNKDFHKDYILKENISYKVGESGRMLESFISSKTLVKFMKLNKCFGNYLNYKYFIGDFSEINNQAIIEFKKTELYNWIRCKMAFFILFKILVVLIILIIMRFVLNFFKMEKSIINLIILLLLLSMAFYFASRWIKKSYEKYSEPYNYEIYDSIDLANNDDTDDEEKPENMLIYPDDYPFASESFLGMYFPFLQFKENKIRRKLRKYLNLSMKNVN